MAPLPNSIASSETWISVWVGVDRGLSVGTANHFEKSVLGHRVASLTIENVVEHRLSPSLIPTQVFEKPERIANAPACIDVDPDEHLVAGRKLFRLARPLQKAPVEAMHVLNERDPKLEARRVHRIANRTTKLGEDHLLPFVDGRTTLD